MTLPTPVQQYLDDVARSLDESLGPRLHAVVLHGSAVLGDFDPSVSDLDLLVAVEDALEEGTAAEVVRRSSHDTIPCPAVGLDLGAHRRETLARPTVPVPYELGLETGAGWGTRRHPPSAEADMILSLALAREQGRALRGPPPEALIGPIPHQWILDAILSTIRWHRATIHDPFHDPTGSFAVLNACRGLHYARHGRFVSKTEGGRSMEREGGTIVAQALLARRDPTRVLPREPILELLTLAERELEEAAEDYP